MSLIVIGVYTPGRQISYVFAPDVTIFSRLHLIIIFPYSMKALCNSLSFFFAFASNFHLNPQLLWKFSVIEIYGYCCCFNVYVRYETDPTFLKV